MFGSVSVLVVWDDTNSIVVLFFGIHLLLLVVVIILVVFSRRRSVLRVAARRSRSDRLTVNSERWTCFVGWFVPAESRPLSFLEYLTALRRCRNLALGSSFHFCLVWERVSFGISPLPKQTEVFLVVVVGFGFFGFGVHEE